MMQLVNNIDDRYLIM